MAPTASSSDKRRRRRGGTATSKFKPEARCSRLIQSFAAYFRRLCHQSRPECSLAEAEEMENTLKELPTELWLRIAHFVPDLDLFSLASVNQLFLDLVTDRRYRQLVIDDDRPLVLSHRLSKIQDDPLVASRVKSLTIHPKAVRSACLRSGKTTRGTLRPVKNEHWPDAFRVRSERFPIEEDVDLADNFLDALARLHSVSEYIIEWKQGVEAERSFCLPLLAAIWPLHASNLRTVKLDMMLSHLCDMLSTVTGLHQLQELALHFTCNDTRFGPSGGPGYEANSAFEQLATFTNRLAPTLQSFTISSIGHLNFSWLYSSLTYFPHLTSLALLVPCDPRHVIDPTGLNQFLHAHRSTIRHFNFSPQYCCHQSTQPPDPIHGCVTTEDWLNRAFGSGGTSGLPFHFQALEFLELGLNILGSGGKRVMVPVPRIGAAAATATHTSPSMSLTIIGCIISLDDLMVLLQPFSSQAGGNAPGTLVLEVHVLNMTLLDVLADLLPGLQRLDLTYRWVGESGCIEEQDFVNNLKSKLYPNWKLWQLVLRCSRCNDDARWPCQQAIARCIPGLQKSP